MSDLLLKFHNMWNKTWIMGMDLPHVAPLS